MSQQYREKLYHGTVSEILRVDVTKAVGTRILVKGFTWLSPRSRRSA